MYNSPQEKDYYGLRMSLRNRKSVMLRVRTQAEASVAISNIPGVVTERTLECQLRCNIVSRDLMHY